MASSSILPLSLVQRFIIAPPWPSGGFLCSLFVAKNATMLAFGPSICVKSM